MDKKKSKRTTVIILIVAFLILLVGMVSCSVRLKQLESQPPAAMETDKPTPLPNVDEYAWRTDTDENDSDLKEDGTDLSDTSRENSISSSKKTAPPSAGPADTKTGTKKSEKSWKSTQLQKSSEVIKPKESAKPTQPVKPTSPLKPSDPAKPTESPKPTLPVKPTPSPAKTDNSGDSQHSGDSESSDHTYYPASVEIILPEYSHTGTEFEVKTVLRNVKSLEWTVTANEAAIPQSDFLKGTLDKTGGKITISKPGDYTLTAIARNYGGSVYTFAKTIQIYPVFEVMVSTEKYAHTDKEFVVTTSLSDNVTQQLNWHIYKDGQEVKWQDTVIGTLTNVGGKIQLKEPGCYTLKAAAFDKTSKEFSGTADIEILPVVEINLQTPKTAHTDTLAVFSTQVKNLGNLSIVWNTSKNGAEKPVSECAAGSLTNEGGSLKFKEKGDYTFTASVTDKAGRIFSTKADLKVYPVATFSFTLPSTAHIDKAIEVSVKSSELQDMEAGWTVLQNGKALDLSSILEGKLTNEGGSIRFTQKGSYTLKATLKDAAGREYRHEETIVIYPVAEVGFYLPSTAHTDTAVEVKTSFKETESLSAEWSLLKDGIPVSLSDGIAGTLTDIGGIIQFKETGLYELKASVTDQTGRSFTYTSSCTVYPVITLNMTLPKQTHTDRPVKAALSGKNMGELPVKWSALKNQIPADITGKLDKEGGTLSLKEKGSYIITAAVTDKAGRTFHTEKEIIVYPVPQMTIVLPESTHTDDSLSLNIDTKDMEGLTAVWYVDNTFGIQNWDTWVDGTLGNNGGQLRFRRAGVYDLEARVTDATGRVFHFDSNRIEILPVLSLSFELPETGHTDTQIHLRTRGNNNILPVEWTLMKNGITIALEDAISGTLNAQGGKIRFTSAGEYRLTATMFDALGRVFTTSKKISIYPLYNCSFTIPNTIHTGQNFAVTIASSASPGGKTIVWSAVRDEKAIALSDFFKGILNNSGGTVHVDTAGEYQLTATITDELGRSFSHTQVLTVTNNAPTKPTLTANVTRTYANGKFLVNLVVNSSDPDGDAITYEYDGKAADNYYAFGSYTVRVRAKDNFGGVSDWSSATFTVTNSAPSQPTITANVNRSQQSNGKYLATLSVNSTDPDGDTVTYEYQNKAVDNYYPIGTHTVLVRAKDNYGGVSAWSQVTFTIANSAPTRPDITRTPGGNSVAPGTPVTITARSTDADGDPITYVWEGRSAETATYPLGKNVVRVKAVDSTGAESPWAAIVFFVADPNRGGGMTLTGPESVITENGVEGATITSWTFTVPAVSGHTANYDYGEVRGFNQLTGQWERLTSVSFDASIGSSFAATDGNTGRVYSNNGVYMYGTLQAGIYTKLQFYYYTPHNCMYHKSNIVYSIELFFN